MSAQFIDEAKALRDGDAFDIQSVPQLAESAGTRVR